MNPLAAASHETDIERFMHFAFPLEWGGIAARILETGAEFSVTPTGWAPRWSKIPMTMRYGENDTETAVKSVIFRVHDCLHQLWGLPHPQRFSTDDFYYYKRAQMCGEIAVLTLTEFVYCAYICRTYPEFNNLINSRNAIPLLRGPLACKDAAQIAMRLDGLLHKKVRPRWVRENTHATAFVEDYVPMLEQDRAQIDLNWKAMSAVDWQPVGAPKARFSRRLDGLELTLWMIQDFLHLMSSTQEVDTALVTFNRKRRAGLVLPDGWAS